MLENAAEEFRRAYGLLIKKEAIAFANTDGGKIYIGCDEAGSVCDDTDVTMISSVISEGISPDPKVLLHCETDAGGLVVTVQEGTGKPYYLSDQGMTPSGVFIRQGAAGVPAGYEQINEMIRLTGDSFETTRSMKQDLTFQEAAGEFVLCGVELDKSRMEMLGITGQDGLYTNLGLLLSDQCTFQVKFAVFNGENNSELITRREATGSVFRQMRSVFGFLGLADETSAADSGDNHTEQPDYPAAALREAVINAIVHRDYAFSGGIIINIYDNRAEFVSIGGIAPGLRAEDLLTGISHPRNEKLAGVFYYLKHIDTYGTGLRRIMHYYEKFSVKPEITATNGAFALALPNLNYAHTLQPADQPKAQHQAVLDYLRENNSINNDVVQEILTVRKTRAYKIIREMVDDGLIVKSGAGKEDREYILAE